MGNTCCNPGAEDAEANGRASGAASAAPPAAKAKAAPARAAPQPRSPAGSSGAAGALDFQMILHDLDQAEQLAYGTA
eukprot:CAMPEP_0183560136 /NCGR_PEP_ID=MMETSP0371-20130417/93926_1 /TAXON_ID=268820 /ORGANISM="Peridinium aciculiferum, Strain PAER-2" /LENGTH=76 /DNA_ID=CAMNT_0025768247 /DNA_START=1 /DNA_END=228 /DNA_ORIENTATION=+